VTLQLDSLHAPLEGANKKLSRPAGTSLKLSLIAQNLQLVTPPHLARDDMVIVVASQEDQSFPLQPFPQQVE
jgi:hypothetical protein